MNLRLPMFGLLLALATVTAVSAQEKPAANSVVSLDGRWSLAIDPKNIGREQKWFDSDGAPVKEAKSAKVPWIIQDTFPDYHGVAWYWRDFTVPANSHPQGRFLLRFWAVDYYAEVWVNGISVGRHEGSESPFTLDMTAAVKPGAVNRVAVRVLNPTHSPIDGIVLKETAHRNKTMPYSAGNAWNQGGIVDSVELLKAPAVRIEDLFVRADCTTGILRIEANLRNAGPLSVRIRWQCSAGPAASGETLAAVDLSREVPPGHTRLEAQLRIASPHLWDLADPFLYRVTARVTSDADPAGDEQSVRSGFRQWNFANGSFRLNGRRVFLRCSHTGNCCPIGLEMPHDPDFLRRDLINAKAMRFNAIRFISGIAKRYQLDLCDEIGLMVYEEPYAAWCLGDSPKMAERYDESVLGMVRRDRNHPSVVIWGLLNETNDGPVFRHAAAALPAVRSLDDSRMVMLNSGRWDRNGRANDFGSLSNPGSAVWEDVLADSHPYQHVPHTAGIIRTLRTLGAGGKPMFLSEYGIGSAVDLLRLARLYEQANKPDADDARFYRGLLDRYLADWKQWKLDELYARPGDFFADSLSKMAGQRLLGLNAIRANPNVVGFSVTGTVDQGMTGEGLWTTFRELKPGTMDAMFDGYAPLRWCLFAEPVHVCRGAKVHVEAVLANEDALAPGEYPARVQVVGPDMRRLLDRTITVTIPKRTGAVEPPMVQACFANDVAIDGPSGKYRLLVNFEQGAAAAGGETEFYATDPADMPAVAGEVVLWGTDPRLAKWLADHGIRTRPYSSASTGREVILAGTKPPGPDTAAAFGELTRRIAAGSSAIFLSPEIFAEGKQPTAHLPLEPKGTVASISSWLYLKDEWAKRHPIFDGLPAGGLMDYTFYREIIPDLVWQGQPPADEAVAGAIKASQDYSSGLLLSVYDLGAGRFILNTLRIRENLDSHPAAERLLRNMIRYAETVH